MKEYEQLISTLQKKITELEAIIKEQAAKITDLEKRLNKNSSNSSKPPSSDGLGLEFHEELIPLPIKGKQGTSTKAYWA